MYFNIGRPASLREIHIPPTDLGRAKRNYDIGILDDEPFLQAKNLAIHGFTLKELGGDIGTTTLVAEYPIVICDIKGVGKQFGSKHEGAHVLHEIRKAYPDKYLIAFTGMQYDATYNEKLNSADKSVTKDATVDQWTQILEEALTVVSNPVSRWLRLRNSLIANNKVDLFDAMQAEQAFIKSVNSKDPGILQNAAGKLFQNSDAMDIVVKFAAAGLGQIIDSTFK